MNCDGLSYIYVCSTKMIHYKHRVGTAHLTLLLRVTTRRLARLRTSVCVHTNTNRRHAHRGPFQTLDEDVSVEMVDWDNMHLHSDGGSNREAVAAATSVAASVATSAAVSARGGVIGAGVLARASATGHGASGGGRKGREEVEKETLLPVSAAHFSSSDRLDELRRGCWGGGEFARRRTQWLVDNSAVLQHIQ